MVSKTSVDRQSRSCLRDVVEARAHPTVVRLDHLDEQDAGWISDTYYLTDDVHRHLQALQAALDRPTGCGIFVIGQYGSGKSHLLAYIVQQLRYERPLIDHFPAASGANHGDKPPALPAFVTAISLLNHRADRCLEDIVLEALEQAERPGDRRQAWQDLARRHPRGVVLIMDELSEFLRSKATPAAFHEDIRFLQFLGEWAQGQRFWILAAMQEQVEHLGELEYGTYRKIKDRYPLRFLLTAGHIVDLLSAGILIKKPGYERAVEAVVADLRALFPQMATEAAQLATIYPIHPATIELLAEVRDRFSQARGVVDFVVVQLNGCPERQVEPFLDRPCDDLLTPDCIVDHFGDLFELQPDFMPLAQQLLPYYRQHLGELFSSNKQVELAWRVIKLLMLTYVSPVRDGLTAEEATGWLLIRAARIDPAKNRTAVQRVLDTLVDQGRYVTQKNGRYSINVRDDGGAALDRFLEREKNELRGHGVMVLESLIPLLTDDDFHPFGLRRDEWQAQRVRWHFHDRQFSVYVGDGEPGRKDGLGICVRLPWGKQELPANVYAVRPASMTAGEEVIELAALVRARERFWGGTAASRLESRFQERLNFFRLQIRNAYREAVILDVEGQQGPAPAVESGDSFITWLGRLAVAALRRTYPGFERFAPVHGPLPTEALRAVMRFAGSRELGEFDADDHVKLVREAYLFPMQLLKRRQRDYVLPAHPENAELVKYVLPLIETETSPKVIYEQLQGPIYGLVPDQVSLLLIYLLLLGEIDILKGRTSYRESFETIPNPVQYDRIVPGQALRGNQVQDLVTICEALQLRVPKQMTVLAQRRAAQALQGRATEVTHSLQGLRARLRDTRGSTTVSDQLQQFLQRIASLHQGDHELQAFQQFLFEFGSAKRFLHEYERFTKLAKKLDDILESLQRFRHLLSHPFVAEWDDTNFTLRLESLGEPPELDQIESLERWLREAQAVYAIYQTEYQSRHRTWWSNIDQHPIWTWQPNRLCESRHLGLAVDWQALQACRERARKLKCQGLINLEFHAACHCGFDGKRSPILQETDRFDTLRNKMDTALRHFFGQQKVRQRMQQWLDDKMEVNPQTLAYVAGHADLPDVHGLDMFDRYMAGVDLVRSLDAADLLDVIGEQTWDVRELLQAVQRYLGQFREEQVRVRVTRQPTVPTEVAAWCLEQCLRHAVPIPRSLATMDLPEAASAMQPSWIGPRTLSGLDTLGLDETIEDRVLAWLIDGQVNLPRQPTTDLLVECAREIVVPVDCQSVADLPGQAHQLYRGHFRMVRLAASSWLSRLDQLARHRPRDLPTELPEMLRGYDQLPWIVVDALGLPLLPWFLDSLPDLFPAWQLTQTQFALVSAHSTTDQWYRDLVEAGVRRPIEKINAVDTLLHERFLPLDDLWRLGLAELTVACRRLLTRLPTDRPLLILADHGFRIAFDGTSYTHGGDSILERLVPVMQLEPL